MRLTTNETTTHEPHTHTHQCPYLSFSCCLDPCAFCLCDCFCFPFPLCLCLCLSLSLCLFLFLLFSAVRFIGEHSTLAFNVSGSVHASYTAAASRQQSVSILAYAHDEHGQAILLRYQGDNAVPSLNAYPHTTISVNGKSPYSAVYRSEQDTTQTTEQTQGRRLGRAHAAHAMDATQQTEGKATRCKEGPLTTTCASCACMLTDAM